MFTGRARRIPRMGSMSGVATIDKGKMPLINSSSGYFSKKRVNPMSPGRKRRK